MDEYNFRRNHVPAFGSWDCNNEMPFTQCFESATEAGYFRYSYSEDRDLYVAGDLYENDVVTPAMIVVPRHKRPGKSGYSKEKERKKDGWVECDGMKASPSPVSLSTPPYIVHAPKALDEDLYKISPALVRTNGKRKRGRSFFSRCLRLDCLC